MRWKFWEPLDQAVAMPNATYVRLPPRRLNLTDIDRLGGEMAAAVGAQTYDFRGGYQNRPMQLADLGRIHPDELSCTLIAQSPQNDRSLVLNLHSRGICAVSWAGPAEQEAQGIAGRYGQLGKPRRNLAWAFPVGLLLVIAAIVVPVVVLLATGDLSLWLIPLVVTVVMLTFMVGAGRVQEAVRRERERTGSVWFDLRPIEQVRLDREQARQRTQAALIWATVAAVVGAAVGAVLTAVLG